jgi:type I restriction enzyme R subunit
MKFTEDKLENAFIKLLSEEGYHHFLGNTIVRALDEVLIDQDLLDYLFKKYQLTNNEAKSIVLQIKNLPSSDLYESNKIFMDWLSNGFLLKRQDRNQKDILIELIDLTLSKNIKLILLIDF